MNLSHYRINHFAKIVQFLLYQKEERLTDARLVSLLNANGITTTANNLWTVDSLKKLKQRLSDPFTYGKTSIVQTMLYLISTGRFTFEQYLLLQSKKFQDQKEFLKRELKRKGEI